MGAETWDERYRATDLLWGAGPNRRFAAEVAGLAPGHALDVGCGEGRNAIWLAEQGWRVTAVDFSPVALERAARLAADRGVDVAFEQHDLRAWQPRGDAFDLVAIIYLHLPSNDLRRVHEAATRAVAPGGTLLVIGHDVRNLRDGHGGPQDPDRLLDPSAVATHLPGLRIDVAETVMRPVEAAPPAVALDTLVRGVRPV